MIKSNAQTHSLSSLHFTWLATAHRDYFWETLPTSAWKTFHGRRLWMKTSVVRAEDSCLMWKVTATHPPRCQGCQPCAATWIWRVPCRRRCMRRYGIQRWPRCGPTCRVLWSRDWCHKRVEKSNAPWMQHIKSPSKFSVNPHALLSGYFYFTWDNQI